MGHLDIVELAGLHGCINYWTGSPNRSHSMIDAFSFCVGFGDDEFVNKMIISCCRPTSSSYLLIHTILFDKQQTYDECIPCTVFNNVYSFFAFNIL